jgi:hypothetical protein
MDLASHSRHFRGRGALLWGAAFFACAQLGLLATMATGRPELRDPEYGLKLKHLKARLTEHCARQPSILVMGSSRVAVGFRPDVMSIHSEGGHGHPVVFNFGLCYSGPVLELICLRRLLADGIHPDWIVLEIWPTLLNLESVEESPQNNLNAVRMRWRDICLLDRYSMPSWKRYKNWVRAQLVPWSAFRYTLLGYYCPCWQDKDSQRDLNWRGLNDWGWLSVPQYESRVDDLSYCIILQRARELAGEIFANLEITSVSELALHEFLTVCHHHRIGVRMLRMPEPSEVRRWYSTASLDKVDRLLSSLKHEFQVEAVDGRAWVNDQEFADAVHLVRNGAVTFTQRLERELILPLLGRRPPGSLSVLQARATDIH